MAKAAISGPVAAVSGIIVSMGLVAISSGLMFGYIPVKLAAVSLPPWVAGMMITAVAGGGILGCLATGALVRRAGHARAFAVLVALETLSFLVIAAGVYPAIWVISRFVYGFAVSGLFIVAQSWLNDATENAWRGRVIALFYMVYVICIGFGSFMLRLAPLEGPLIPVISVVFVTLAIMPVALTRLPNPPPPEAINIAFRAVWNISPVGFAGLFAVGGLTMLVQGFAPIYTSTIGYTKDDVGLLMFLMQFGMLTVQLPLGAWSDRTDRRRILVIAGLLVAAMSGAMFSTGPYSFLIMAVIFAIWGGATESIYAIANAHANDRADPRYYVSLSSTLLIAWSISGFIVPAVATALTPLGGPKTFMGLALAIALAYTAFVIVRLRSQAPVPDEETEDYVPISAHIPYSTELATGDLDPDIEQEIPVAGEDRLDALKDRASAILNSLPGRDSTGSVK